MADRTCKVCGAAKDENFGFGPPTPDGIQKVCNGCLAERARRWRAANPERSAASQAAFRERRKASVRAMSAEQQAEIKKAKNDKDKKYRAENREKLREKDRLRHLSTHRQLWLETYKADAAVIESKAKYNATYSKRPTAKARRKYLKKRSGVKDKMLSYMRRYRTTRRFAFVMYQNKRITRIKGLNPLDVERVAVLRAEPRCWYCGVEFSAGIGVCIEHIIPISRGGTNANDNLAASCQSCNSSKGSKTLEEWCPPLCTPEEWTLLWEESVRKASLNDHLTQTHSMADVV